MNIISNINKTSKDDLDHLVDEGIRYRMDEPARVDFRKILSVIIRRRYILFISLLAAASMAVLYLVFATPIYTATTTLLIDSRKTSTVKSDAILSDMMLDINTISTEVSLVKSFAVSRRVVERLNLTQNPLFGHANTQSRVYGWTIGLFSRPTDERDLATKRHAGDPPQFDFSPETLKTIERVQSSINARRVGTTYLIEVSVSFPDARLAAALANAVADSYLDEQLEARSQTVKRAADGLDGRVSALRLQLAASERSLADHRAKYNLAKPAAGTLAEQQAAEINAQLVAARGQTVDQKSKYDQARRILEGGSGIETVAAVVDSAALSALRAEEATISRQESELVTRYGPLHPTLVKIRAQHADINAQIKREIGRVVETLRTDYKLAQEKEASLEGSLHELTGTQHRNDESIIQLRELERDVETNRVLYETLLARSKEAEQQTSLQIAESRIIGPAFAPPFPSSPQKWRLLLVGISGGLFLGLCGIAFLEYFETGFTAAAQVEKALNLPVLAVIPMLSRADLTINGRISAVPAYAVHKHDTAFGEAVRSARLMTQISGSSSPPKAVLITSSISAEGKTTLAMSMALSAAAFSKQRILIIDCDLRARSVSRQFNLLKKPGLTEILTGNSVTEDVIFQSNTEKLHVLAAGEAVDNPGDLLGSERMRFLLQNLRSNYDIIYLDAPPLLPVVDSVLLSQFVDKIMLVVRWRTTPRNIVRSATQLIENCTPKLSGVSLNGASIDDLTSYDPYNAYHHKSYWSFIQKTDS